jgi:hypothetical protein
MTPKAQATEEKNRSTALDQDLKCLCLKDIIKKVKTENPQIGENI